MGKARHDLNQISYEYAVEVMNRFKELDLVNDVPKELWMEVCNIVQEAANKTIPKKRKSKKAKWLSKEASQIAEAGIKIGGRNINSIRYADDTMLMAESEKELKSLLMRVKEESERTGLKLNIKKTKIVATSPITSWQIEGKRWKS